MVVIDYKLKRAVVSGRSVVLTPIRWCLYRCLFEADGAWVDKKALYEAAWDEQDYYVSPSLVGWHICQLRKVVGGVILSQNGFGYRLVRG